MKTIRSMTAIVLSLSNIPMYAQAGFLDSIKKYTSGLNSKIQSNNANYELEKSIKPSMVKIFNCFDSVLFERDVRLYDDIYFGVSSYPQLKRVFHVLPDAYHGEDMEGTDAPNVMGFAPKRAFTLMGIKPKKAIISAAGWGYGFIDLTLVSPHSVEKTAELVQKKLKYPLTKKVDEEGKSYIGYSKIFPKPTPNHTFRAEHSLTIKKVQYPAYYGETDAKGDILPQVEVSCTMRGTD